MDDTPHLRIQPNYFTLKAAGIINAMEDVLPSRETPEKWDILYQELEGFNEFLQLIHDDPALKNGSAHVLPELCRRVASVRSRINQHRAILFKQRNNSAEHRNVDAATEDVARSLHMLYENLLRHMAIR